MRRRWAVVGVVAVLAAAAGWWRWGREAPPPPKAPPAVDTDDPVVAEAVGVARGDVLARPADAAAWGRLGSTLLANGLSDPARECLAEAGRLDPADRRWPYLEGVSLLLRDPVAALPCWRRAAECPGDDDRALAARLRWAEALVEHDRPAEAEPVLRAVLAIDPGDARAHYTLGLCAAARGDTAAAADHLRRCAADPAARKKAAERLAALYAAANRPAEAADAARRAAALPADADWPDPILQDLLPLTVGRDALFIQAEKQQQAGNVPRAAELYDRVIRRYPDDGRAYTKLGMLLAEAGDYPGAERVLRDGLRVAPDMVQGHFFLAVALFHQAERAGLTTAAGRARLVEAADEARRTTELKPDHGFAHLYLGLAARHLGRRADARAALRAAVRCTPDAVDPHLHLGQFLWDVEGDATAALGELETAVRLAGPNDSRPRAALVRVRAAVRTAPEASPTMGEK